MVQEPQGTQEVTVGDEPTDRFPLGRSPPRRSVTSKAKANKLRLMSETIESDGQELCWHNGECRGERHSTRVVWVSKRITRARMLLRGNGE